MFQGLDAPTIISRILTLLIAFTIHELSHAVTADRLGDDTARRLGRISLNPLVHLDPIGSLLLIFAGFGWAKPVPVNPYNLRNGPQMGMAVVAAAGPISNFLMALIGAIPFRLGLLPFFAVGPLGGFLPSPSQFLLDFVEINLLLMLFNLIPIAPLDGSKILRGFAPRSWEPMLATLEQWGPFLLLALVFLGGGILGAIMGPPLNFLGRVIFGGMKRARYRAGQFRDYVWPRAPGPRDMADIRRVLPPPLEALFLRQTAGEQAHALRVMRTAAASGVQVNRLPLLQAALLHDVGKTRAPLSLLERVAVVLAGRYWPSLNERSNWRPFVTTRNHAEWGAELCAEAGAPPLTVELVRRHQAPAAPDDKLLAVLQMADDDN